MAGSTSRLNVLDRYPAAQVTTLSNGIRVATETFPVESATVGVWINSGSRYETMANNGVAHFLEHLLFKGTPSRTQREIEESVENMGAHLNAYTSREQTAYFGKCLSSDVAPILSILADILQNSNISEASVEREKGVILREMQEVEGMTEEVVFDYLHHAAFREQSLGMTILGPRSNIENMRRETLQQFVKEHYTAERMVIAGAGGIEHDQLVSLAEKLFGSIPKRVGHPVSLPPARFTGSDYRHRFDDMPLASLAYAFPTAGYVNPAHYDLMAIQTMIGNYEKGTPYAELSPSKLVAKVAEYDLAEKMMGFSTVYQDTGLFGIYATAHPYKLHELQQALCDEIAGFAYDVDKTRLELAKRALLTNSVSHYENLTNVCDELGRQILSYGRRIHPTEVQSRIEQITKESVQATAEDYFYDKDFALSAFGPVYELPDYNLIRMKTYFNDY